MVLGLLETCLNTPVRAFFKIMWEPLETIQGHYLTCLHVKEPKKNKSSAPFHQIAPQTEAQKIKKSWFSTY